MTNDLRKCPECKTGRLKVRSSRKLGEQTVEKRRECQCCQYRDVVLTKPEVIVSIRVVVPTNVPPSEVPHNEQ